MPHALVASLLLCGTAAAAEKYPTEGGVVVLDPTNFAGFIAEQEYTIVEFYAPWYARPCSCSSPEDTAAASRLQPLHLGWKHCPACCTTALHGPALSSRCGHCKSLEPEWSAAAKKVSKLNPKVSRELCRTASLALPPKPPTPPAPSRAATPPRPTCRRTHQPPATSHPPPCRRRPRLGTSQA